MLKANANFWVFQGTVDITNSNYVIDIEISKVGL